MEQSHGLTNLPMPAPSPFLMASYHPMANFPIAMLACFTLITNITPTYMAGSHFILQNIVKNQGHLGAKYLVCSRSNGLWYCCETPSVTNALYVRTSVQCLAKGKLGVHLHPLNLGAERLPALHTDWACNSPLYVQVALSK